MLEVVYALPPSSQMDEDVNAFHHDSTLGCVSAAVVEDDRDLVDGHVGSILAADEESQLVCRKLIVSK